MDILPKDKAKSWTEILQKKRGNYESIIEKYKLDSIDLNSLLQENEVEDNHSNSLKIIKQDLLRTHSEMEFFQEEKIQNIMFRILYIYAMDHQDTSYRQGKKKK